MVWGNPTFDLPPFDPLAWMERNGVSPHDAGTVLIELLLQGDLSTEARKLILTTAQGGDPDNLRKAIQLIIHCPEYQLV